MVNATYCFDTEFCTLYFCTLITALGIHTYKNIIATVYKPVQRQNNPLEISLCRVDRQSECCMLTLSLGNISS